MIFNLITNFLIFTISILIINFFFYIHTKMNQFISFKFIINVLFSHFLIHIYLIYLILIYLISIYLIFLKLQNFIISL